MANDFKKIFNDFIQFVKNDFPTLALAFILCLIGAGIMALVAIGISFVSGLNMGSFLHIVLNTIFWMGLIWIWATIKNG